jgi:hypothetical protein
MTENYLICSYEDGFAALRSLERAHAHLVGQFDLRMTRAEAQAHFDARALLLKRRLALVDEMELEYFYGECDAWTAISRLCFAGWRRACSTIPWLRQTGRNYARR